MFWRKKIRYVFFSFFVVGIFGGNLAEVGFVN
jgi:hypothetical protein